MQPNDVQIVKYEPKHADAFRDLNLAWLSEHFQIEDVDHQQLSHPEESILRSGGLILVAESNGSVLGVCTLIYESPVRYEVTKMTVRKDIRTQGIGRKLLNAAISEARALGAKELFTFSNTILEPALYLYRSEGFTEIPLPTDAEYTRANIALELQLG